jgi:hypothetical protein
MLKNDARIFFKYLPEICDFHKEITIFTKKRAILHVNTLFDKKNTIL